MKRLLSIILSAIIIVISVTFASAESQSIVSLFSGSATAEFTTWSDWGTAVSLGNSDFNLNDFKQPFHIEVEYESNKPPILVFLSWTGGNGWAEVKADGVSNGKAYYSYNSIVESYGSDDFSLLNSIRVKPYGENLTVTGITLFKGEDETDFELKGKAGEIVNNINVGWNLGNTLDVSGDWIAEYTQNTPTDYETAWHNPITTPRMITMVKNAGFNAVRLPVTWGEHLDDNYNIDEKWLDRVQEVVNYVVDNDMYCIINVHHDTGKDGWLRASRNNLAENKEKFTALWEQISSRFSMYDDHLLFESFNEILDDENNWSAVSTESTDVVNELNQLFVDTVRKSGNNNSERCLVVNTYASSKDDNAINNFVVPNDTVENSLIVEVHAYRPYEYCASIEDGYEQAVWTDNNGKETIDRLMSSLYYRFIVKGIPVIIGEFGANDKNNSDDRSEYANYYVSKAKEYGIKCFWWDKGGVIKNENEHSTSYALLDRYNYRWIFPNIVKSLTGVDVSYKVKYGDVNCDGTISVADILLLSRAITQNTTLTGQQSSNADVNKDGYITLADEVLISKHILAIVIISNS